MSLVPEGSITRQSNTGQDSLLIHIFISMAFLGNPLFLASCSISFERSISSDHAALFVNLPLSTPPPIPTPQPGWIIEDQMEQEWKKAFAVFPHPLITDVKSLTRASNNLLLLTNFTCDRFFAKKKTTRTRGLAWWNEACHIAASDISRAHGPERRCLSAILQASICHVK
jgi:hypothetical protein